MKFETEPKGTLVFSRSYNPAWGEMDALGHINNTRYFVWCEQTRIAWLESMGEMDYLSGKSKMGPVIINAGCTFHRQVVYPCNLEIHLYAGEPGRSSFITWYEIVGADDGILRCTGTAKIVWVDYLAEKSVPMPDKIRKAVLADKN